MVDESIEIFENLPSLDRNAYEALLYAAACHPEKYRQLSCYLENWSEKYASHIEQKALVFSKHKKKKIRIGYVSPDFRRHPVAYFLVGSYIHTITRMTLIYTLTTMERILTTILFS